MTLVVAWSLLKRFWWAIPMAGLLLAATWEHRSASRWRAKQVATQSAFDTTVANYRAASAKAIADNLADVRAKESDAAILVEDKQHDIEGLRAQARTLAADYARGLRAASAANSGSGGQAISSETASTASNPFRAGGVPLLDEDDVRICTDNTVKALGWPEYYTPLRTRYNADGQP